ncbi:MAG TPA: arsenate reductase ArsC [Blastocatellia bacterium]|nr:arsenate reductase ArsC [Blastocatellia bacterium]
MTPKKILFVCIGNACRSPMAEGFARHHGGNLIEAHSAGVYPYGQICEETIKVMKERGIDITKQRSKGISEYVLRDFDLIVSMAPMPLSDWQGSVGEIYWDVHDPFRQSLKEFRKVRDEIEQKVKSLLGKA